MKNKDTVKLDEIHFWFGLELKPEEEEDIFHLEIYDSSGKIATIDIPDDFSTESAIVESALREFVKWLNNESDIKKVEVI